MVQSKSQALVICRACYHGFLPSLAVDRISELQTIYVAVVQMAPAGAGIRDILHTVKRQICRR